MNILIALVPALTWGVGPLIVSKVGGRPINQLLGTCYGEVISGLALFFMFHPSISLSGFFWCFIGGFLWAIAQLMQFTSFTDLDVSTAMPISTGLQLIEIPLAGVIFWGEWAGGKAKLIGFSSILLLIIGIILTGIRSKGNKEHVTKKMNYKAGLALLLIGSLGYTAFSVFPRIPDASGVASLLPQTFGQFLGAVALTPIMSNSDRRHHVATVPTKAIWLNKRTLGSIIVGLLGGLGTLAYLTSLKSIGVATSFPLTQLSVVISTLGGIVILHEHKTRKELTFTFIGLALLIIAAFMISKID
ncbi:glucose uptake protein [Philodulcilactobacillus myokoensis]|uniref:Glucose uptake protein n=1 Tax=Philodulcilactobacillus myokoensis TaxID=2929573 RepID=A0A9W6B028_9LACO|nr:GRP family sugar transporter [Philodulcilactobacillus myokoensis]GLB46110.1 glucose uptake protein [Philodulcilactobacillus myokoensis]